MNDLYAEIRKVVATEHARGLHVVVSRTPGEGDEASRTVIEGFRSLEEAQACHAMPGAVRTLHTIPTSPVERHVESLGLQVHSEFGDLN